MSRRDLRRLREDLSRPDPLYLTEQQIAARLGFSARKWQDIAGALERSGLPRRDPTMGNRRYWPAVQVYLDRRNRVVEQSSHGIASSEARAKEKWT